MGLFKTGHPESEYLDIMNQIRLNGIKRGKGRTSESYNSIFGSYIKFDIKGGKTMPLLHTKKVFLRGIIHELIWMCSGSTNNTYLRNNNVHIWDEWSDENGELGPVYGKQLRAFGQKMVDQLHDTIEQIKSRPQSRRHVITLWNPEDCPDETITPQENVAVGRQALACCHGTFIQFFIDDDKNEIHMMTHQRSADIPLGVPFNLMFYSMLLLMVGKLTGLTAREITYSFGDTHIYENQFDGVNENLKRRGQFIAQNMHDNYPQPSMVINGNQKEIEDFKHEDFEIQNYNPMPVIKFPRPAI